MRQAENGVPVIEGDADLRQRLHFLEDESKHLEVVRDELEHVRDELEHYKGLYASLQQQCQGTKPEVGSSFSLNKIRTLSFCYNCSQDKELW